MNPETEEKLTKVKRYSTSLRRVFNFFTFLVVLGAVVSLLIALTRGTTEASATFAVFGRVFTGEEITWPLKILAAIWLLILSGVAIKCLRHLAKLFNLYSQGKIFTAEDVFQIRQIGITVFLFFAASVFSMLAKLILLALDLPLGVSAVTESPTVSLSFDSWMAQILAGTMIIVISWIMDVGREMREEQDLTV